MKELRDGIELHYGEKKVVPICPICGDFLVPYHRPPGDCMTEPPNIQLAFQEPHDYLVQDPDGDWWLFPQCMEYDGTTLAVHSVCYVPHPLNMIEAYSNEARRQQREMGEFALHLEEILDEMERE